MILVISYELRKPDHDYASLYNAIENIPGSKIHAMTSHWFVDTTLTPEQVNSRLNPHIHQTHDYLFIGRLQGARTGWLMQSVGMWLNQKVF